MASLEFTTNLRLIDGSARTTVPTPEELPLGYMCFGIVNSRASIWGNYDGRVHDLVEEGMYQIEIVQGTGQSTTAVMSQKATTDEIATLKSDLGELRSHTKNIFEGEIVQGNINSNGQDTDDLKDYFVRTDTFIPIDTTIVQEDNQCYINISFMSYMNAFRVAFYDENETFISMSTGATSNQTIYGIKDKFFIVPSETKFMRFAVYGSNGDTKFTPSDITNVQVEYGYRTTEYVYPYTAKDDYARELAEKNTSDIKNVSDVVNSKTSLHEVENKLKAKSNYNGNFISLNPVDIIKARLIVKNPPTENKTWTIKQYGKNMATYAQSATIGAKANDTTWFSVDLYMQKGKTYTISYKQEEQLESALQNSISVVIGGVNYLSPLNLDNGRIVFKFTSPVTAAANIGIYTYNLSSDIHVSEFQIEADDKNTEYENPVYKANVITITPTTEYIDVDITPFEGVNNLCCSSLHGYMEVSCYENDSVIYSLLDEKKIPWNFACGNIVCIGDSLTDGLYAPVSKGKIKQNYPYYLGRILHAEVDNIGKSGSYPSEVYNTIYPSQDFSKYDTAIIWLGTNGGLFNDFSDGTQADYYCKLIDGIKSQKPDIQFFIGTVFVTGEISSGVEFASVKETNETIKAISEKYEDIPIIDFSDLTSTGERMLHNMQANTHFGKSGNIYIANRIANFMQKYFEEDITRVEFGLLTKQ